MNMPNVLDVLDQVGRSKTSGSGEYFSNPGQYRVRIDQLLWKPDAYNGPSFIAETTIISAQATSNKKLKYDPIAKEMKDVEALPHKVGEKRSMVLVLKAKENDPSHGNLLQFLCALTGLPKTFVADKDEPNGKYKKGDEVFTFDGPGIRALCSEEQTMKGAEVDLTVFDKVQKADKTKTFTNLKWAHVAPDEATSTATTTASTEPAPTAA